MATNVQQCPTEGWCEMGFGPHLIHRKTEFFTFVEHNQAVSVSVVAESDGVRQVEIEVPRRLPLDTTRQLGAACARVWTSYND